MRTFFLVVALAAASFLACRADATQGNGPSPKLYSSPYYTCLKNYYVATTGSDSNPGTSASLAWATLQHANNSLSHGVVAAGSCINVAPGTYSGVDITNGGNHASSTGYVVYRCAKFLGCTVNGNAGTHGAAAFETRWNTNGTPPNYIMIDGFKMAGGNLSSNGVGVGAWNGNNGAAVASHHIWIINNDIYGFGQSGIGIAAGEYYYIIHNLVYGNSNIQCNSQGSGIAINIMHQVPNYTPTADDRKNPNPLLGPTWVIGDSFFHNVVEWNVVENNAITRCGTPTKPTNTDGNGIIFDSNLTGHGNTENYMLPSLAAFNLVYNNGAGGIHLFFSAIVTVANNSCYNNDLDPSNGGTGRACMDDSNGFGDTFINNIAVAIPANTGGKCWINPISPPFAMYNFAILGSPSQPPYDTFSNNITQIIGSSCNNEVSVYNGDIYSCSNEKNKCATNAAWLNVGNTTVGTENYSPVGANFALKPGSPAIGYGLTTPYLPSQSVDAGACFHTLTICD